jgi:hypothetical protein
MLEAMRFNGDEAPQQGDTDSVSLSDLSGDHRGHTQPLRGLRGQNVGREIADGGRDRQRRAVDEIGPLPTFGMRPDLQQVDRHLRRGEAGDLLVQQPPQVVVPQPGPRSREPAKQVGGIGG